MPGRNAANFRRLLIKIEGVVDRVQSSVGDLVDGMEEAGASPQAIATRVNLEIRGGPGGTGGALLSELKKFAATTVPGYAGDMVNRFAIDTISRDTQSRKARAKFLEELGADATVTDSQEASIKAALEKQGIDIEAFESKAELDIPPEASLDDLYLWVAVIDAKTCSVCDGNHGAIRTLKSWAEIGEPRSGACLGDQNCRCVLVPIEEISEEDVEDLKEPVNLS